MGCRIRQAAKRATGCPPSRLSGRHTRCYDRVRAGSSPSRSGVGRCGVSPFQDRLCACGQRPSKLGHVLELGLDVHGRCVLHIHDLVKRLVQYVPAVVAVVDYQQIPLVFPPLRQHGSDAGYFRNGLCQHSLRGLDAGRSWNPVQCRCVEVLSCGHSAAKRRAFYKTGGPQ